MNELVKIPFGEHAVALDLPPNLTEQQWKQVGHRLMRCKDALQFWIGDWVNYGMAEYGSKYDEAMKVFNFEGKGEYGYEKKTLENFASVAKRVQSSLRREKLSFGHHAVVASLDQKDQDIYLAMAVMNGWSVAELTKQLRGRQKLPAAGDTNDTRGFFFDGWVTDWNRGISLFPITQWTDDVLQSRFIKLHEIETQILTEAEKRNLPIVEKIKQVEAA